MNTIRYMLHVWRCWLYQLQQSKALADIEHARHVQKDAARRLTQATWKDIEERAAFAQWRRVMREVAR